MLLGRVVDSSALGQLVRERRRVLGLSQLETAELAEVSERFVRLVESGKTSVQFDKLVALLTTLGLELDVTVRTPC